jgi:hypothetical protein
MHEFGLGGGKGALAPIVLLTESCFCQVVIWLSGTFWVYVASTCFRDFKRCDKEASAGMSGHILVPYAATLISGPSVRYRILCFD